MSFGPSASWPALRLRAALAAKVREFFNSRGFLEVDTPLLSRDSVVDRHLDPLQVILPDDVRRPDVGPKFYLQTSPEFCLKRLLAATVSDAEAPSAIYQLGKAFRAAEAGAQHNPEFTMLEWYRVGDDYAEGMQLLDELCQALLQRGPAARLTYQAAMQQHAGVDPFIAENAELASLCDAPQESDPGDQRELLLDLLFVERVQPKLRQPTIVCDFPASGAALARTRREKSAAGEHLVAERFELFAEGVELANGYHELTDRVELRRRNKLVNEQRQRDGKPQLPEDSRLLEAMEAGLPPASGTALGFDRLVMVAGGYQNLGEVLAFPIDRA